MVIARFLHCHYFYNRCLIWECKFTNHQDSSSSKNIKAIEIYFSQLRHEDNRRSPSLISGWYIQCSHRYLSGMDDVRYIGCKFVWWKASILYSRHIPNVDKDRVLEKQRRMENIRLQFRLSAIINDNPILIGYFRELDGHHVQLH